MGGAAYLYVDATSGVDNACCGRTDDVGAWGGPCLTVTYALTLVTEPSTTIAPACNGHGNVSPLETYPIQLANGVTLSPGTVPCCYPGVAGQPVFSVATDTMGANIGGSSVGGCTDAATPGLPSDGVFIGTTTSGTQSANLVGGGGTISRVVYGLHLDGGSVGAGVPTSFTISDVMDGVHAESTNANGIPSAFEAAGLTITGATRYDIFAGVHGSVYMQGPCEGCGTWILGQKAGGCSGSQDHVGIHVEADGSASIGYGPNDPSVFTVNCMTGNGIELMPGPMGASGTPTVTLNHDSTNTATITHCGCAGVLVQAGSFKSGGTVFSNDHWGVWVDSTTATVSLDGTTPTYAPNVFGCFTDAEPGSCTASSNGSGFGIWNNGPTAIDAAGNEWSVSPPSACTCDDTVMSCGCSGIVGSPSVPPNGTLIVNSPLAAGGSAPVTNATNPASGPTPTCP
jgi:hypothetical protein